MIDLTPLDVRKKRGDFRTVFRGYEPDEVDEFLEVVAERLETLVKEKLTLEERVERLQEQVASQEGREEAVREALVTAQELRRDVREQARREADLLRREAESRVEQIVAEAERRLEERREALEELERMRRRFLKSFRTLLERQMDAVEVEEGRSPLDDVPLEIDFTVGDLEESVPDVDEGGPAPESAAAGGRGRDPEGSEKEPEGGAGAEPAESRPQVGEEPVEGPPPSAGGEAGAPDAGTEEAGTEAEPRATGGPGHEPGPERPISEGPGDASAQRDEGGEEDESLWLSAILKEEEGEGPEEKDEGSWS